MQAILAITQDDCIGYNKDCIGYNKYESKQDKANQDESNQDKDKPNDSKQDKANQEESKQDKDYMLPFVFPDDLKRFKSLTLGGVIIMGHKTYKSIGKPLPGRINIVLSTQNVEYPGIVVTNSIKETLTIVSTKYKQLLDERKVFVIGGDTIYKQFSDVIHKWHVTYVSIQSVHIDGYTPVRFDPFDYGTSKYLETKSYNLSNEHMLPTIGAFGSDNVEVHFMEVESTLKSDGYSTENDLLHLMNNILLSGEERKDRTGVGTKSIFAPRDLTFSLENNAFPLQTTRRIFFRGIVEELLWFLRGSTNAKELDAKSVKIWNGNSSHETLDRIGLKYEEGDCGPIYGFQWRHAGAEYKDCHTDYTGKGVDQLAEVIELIKTDPTSRRIFMSAWIPGQVKQGCLPPCHISYQFYVHNGTHLSCKFYQRSSDVFLAGNWNIASAALLTILIAKETNLQPRSVTVSVGDAHIYANHFQQTEELLSRAPLITPKLFLLTEKKSVLSFDPETSYKFEDFLLFGYYPHAAIKADMNV